MSGGGRQRLGLARAALRDSSTLVLDDELSSLDVATAARVFAALGSLPEDRTPSSSRIEHPYGQRPRKRARVAEGDN